MKKTFLAGIVVLTLSASAHSAARLPDTITGGWCWDDNVDPNRQAFSRVSASGCPDGDPFYIEQEGTKGNGSCIFEKVEQISEEVFMVYSRCDFGKAAPITLELIGGKLVSTVLPQG